MRTKHWWWDGGKKVFLVSDLCGGSLAQVLFDKPRQPIDTIREWIEDIIMGLYDLDALHITHRDLKPENILVARNGRLLIADFGCASTEPKMWKAHGTRQYRSPEMQDADPEREEAFYDRRADLYALGLLIIEMFRGTPWDEGEDWQVGPTQELVEEHVDVPEYRDLIYCLLHSNPEKRIQLDELPYHPVFAETDWEKIHERIGPVQL
ncbi:kinase-like protein, partial [Stereum hirsutum FP-91666 SS1]|uniref:kinase-like protein n=1 Tax=Stereum hirsutum (strain FP-91666) TaxID=721885 RepID=UPI000444995C